LYLSVWRSMCCLSPVLLLIRSANRSNWFHRLVRLMWGVQEVRSVRPVVRIGQTGFLCCVLSFFILLCVNSCHMHYVYLYDTFTLVITPQIERYRGSSMIPIEYVQMACLGNVQNFSGNAHFSGELPIYL
jgi:hypothetical protein